VDVELLEPPIEPMLARLTRELPVGPDLVYEPKWDGFRCLSFRTGDAVDLRSRNQRPLARYFPEVVAALRSLAATHAVIDGELLVTGGDRADFAALMSRLHPAASRVELLARTAPATLVVFDLLAVGDDVLVDRPFAERRRRLEDLVADGPPGLRLCPSTRDPAVARSWLTGRSGRSGGGIDGVVVKDATAPYEPGRRAMTKVKLERTADCVVAGFRWLAARPLVSSLLVGMYDGESGREVLRHVGVVTAFATASRQRLIGELAPLAVSLEGHPWEHGFALEGGPTGRLKGAADRWTPDMELDWVPLAPERVCEVAYDQVDGRRFRHAARWRRWRPDRSPRSCRIEQLDQAVTP
jgi:ATP-dependent DNA ligase